LSTANQASSLVCQRYANALIQQAEVVKKLDQVEKDLHDLSAMIGASDDFRAVIRSPLLSATALNNALGAIADKAKFQDVTKSFLGTLIENSRLNALEKIIIAFGDALAKKRGEMKVDVQVAQDLSAKQKKELEASLSKALGGDVSINLRVEPAIIGGMIVTVGSRMIDDSVARKLSRLKAAMGSQANENSHSDSNIKEVK
jgi:F-type H+-transporting ATPase subunit delta